MSKAIHELTAEIANLSDKISGLSNGGKIYTTPMASELTKREHFIALVFQSLMTYAYPRKSVDEICAIAIEAGSKLSERIETQNQLQ
jgi:hypothetical protein